MRRAHSHHPKGVFEFPSLAPLPLSKFLYAEKKKQIARADFEKTIVKIPFFLYNNGIHALGRK